VCSQDDYLWDELTAREHMLLTAIFKGIRWGPELHAAVDSVLNLVQLYDRGSEFCGQYSGGMKRRLSVAMSTVGDVEILFLDEPTTGLDPVSRRRVWEAINTMKKNRVVVLTTHNMEEADYLADTIMIMHSGHVRAFGDPLFLKQTFGKGYQVNILVREGGCGDTSLGEMEGYHSYSEEAQEMILSILPDAHCLYDENSLVMTVTVPKINLIGLPRLFSWLESSRRAQEMVKEWGVSNTTLEQVFLLLCVQNTEINLGVSSDPAAGGGGGGGGGDRENLCPMCNIRPREHVILRNLNQEMIVIPNSICWECSVNNPHYKIHSNNGSDVGDVGGEGVVLSLDQMKEQNLIEYLIREENNQQRQVELQKLIQKAQVQAEIAFSQQLLLREEQQQQEQKQREAEQEEVEGTFNHRAWNEESMRLIESQPQLQSADDGAADGQGGVTTKRGRDVGSGDLEAGHAIPPLPSTRAVKKEQWGGSTTSQV
jgi:ABC-type multidrug transport system ATPase subunit